MKSFLLTAMLLGSILLADAQAPRPHRYEVGAEGLNYVPLASPARPRLQWLSGVLFRYTPGKVGFRAAGGFSQRVTRPYPRNCADCPAGETSAHALTLRVGSQYAPVPKLAWLYTFVDVAYQTTSATGEYMGGFCGCLDFTQTRTTRGGGVMAGIGANIRFLSRLSLAPELYYEGFVSRATSLYVDRRLPQTSTLTQRETTHTPAIRLQAAVGF